MLRKKAYSSMLYNPTVQGKTVADLFMAIRADGGLPHSKKMQIIQQVQCH